MVIILFYQDVLLASAIWYAVDITFLCILLSLLEYLSDKKGGNHAKTQSNISICSRKHMDHPHETTKS